MLLTVQVVASLVRPLVPWSIIELNDEELTFVQLFERIQAGSFDIIEVTDDLKRAERCRTFVGSKRDSLMTIGNDHVVARVCSQFGNYVKFLVEISVSPPCTSTAINAFTVMAAAQRRQQLGDNGLPFPQPVRDGRDRMYNDLLGLMREMGIKWSDPATYGVPFLRALRDVLWYVDGHQDTIAEKAPKIPELFAKRFTGYNRPESHKHRKRPKGNLSRSELSRHALLLQEKLQASWFKKEVFKDLAVGVEGLVGSLNAYATYLSEKTKYQKLHHELSSPAATPSDSSHLDYLPKIATIPSSLQPIDKALKLKDPYIPIAIADFAPSDRRQRYRYIKDLEKGLSVSSMLYIYTPGGSVLNHHFLWRLPENFSLEASLSVNQQVVMKLVDQLPVYHTRAMKREFTNLFGLLMDGAKPYVLRGVYRELTRDSSVSRTSSEEEIDERVKEVLASEDTDIVIDLRELNEGRKSKYDVFWDKCTEYISECTAVPERRHGDVCFMATAISVRDLIAQVTQKCPPGTPIPSESWVRLNFSPRNPHTKAAQHYTGRLKVKHVVQKRMFRKSHPDEHYCAALFRYQRELAVKYRDLSAFICIDDKHRIKVGEPGYPVAAAERGRQVIVSQSETFAVGDHDFTRFSLIPSVVLQVDIPEMFEGSWYTGQVFVGLKDAVFEASSPLRHAVELHSLLLKQIGDRTILFIYSDGGPDHRLTYISVQLSLIALFLNLNLDFLVACRTAPNHSWKNPVERIMSLLNIGLQCVGIMRAKMTEEFELSIKNCNNLQQLRQAADKNRSDVASSLLPAIDLLHDIFKRLQLKGKSFEPYEAASEEEIQEFWSVLLLIESCLTREDTTKKAIKKKPKVIDFVKHCCKSRHYSFQVKKCGLSSCELCKPVRMDQETFSELHYLPDPIPGDEGHYKSFGEVYGQCTSEEYRPSLLAARKAPRKSVGYSPSQQHVNNVGLLVQCEECDMWRLLFCKHKLNYQEITELGKCLDDISYTCGVMFSELDLPGRLKNVCVKDHKCGDPIEKLYYSCDFEAICCWCASENVASEEQEHLPLCQNCKDQGLTPVKRPKGNSDVCVVQFYGFSNV